MVELARLESVYTRKGIKGSNPFFSADKFKCPFMGHFSWMERGKFTFQRDRNEKCRGAQPRHLNLYGRTPSADHRRYSLPKPQKPIYPDYGPSNPATPLYTIPNTNRMNSADMTVFLCSTSHCFQMATICLEDSPPSR